MKGKNLKLHSKKKELIQNLINEHAFWSYSINDLDEISDECLIENVLLHLDIEDVTKLYHLYPKKKLKQIWIQKLIPNQHYYSLNRFYAFWLFDIKNQDRYLKTQMKKRRKEMLCKD